jgi:molybdopterin converting factor small subunit
VTVTVKLFASFRAGRFDVKIVDYPAGTTVADVVDSLALPRTDVGIILLNSRHAELDRPLAEGDNLALIPLLGGG